MKSAGVRDGFAESGGGDGGLGVGSRARSRWSVDDLRRHVEQEQQHVGGGERPSLDFCEADVAAEMRGDRFAIDGFRHRIFVDAGQVLRGDEADSRLRLHVLHEAAEHSITPLRFGGRPEARLLPRRPRAGLAPRAKFTASQNSVVTNSVGW